MCKVQRAKCGGQGATCGVPGAMRPGPEGPADVLVCGIRLKRDPTPRGRLHVPPAWGADCRDCGHSHRDRRAWVVALPLRCAPHPRTVPRACQPRLGPGERAGPGAPRPGQEIRDDDCAERHGARRGVGTGDRPRHGHAARCAAVGHDGPDHGGTDGGRRRCAGQRDRRGQQRPRTPDVHGPAHRPAVSRGTPAQARVAQDRRRWLVAVAEIGAVVSPTTNAGR